MTKPRRHEPLPDDRHTTDGHTAELVVRVLPIGQPGYVRYTVTDNGPSPLSPAEQARVLRAAAELVEAGGHPGA